MDTIIKDTCETVYTSTPRASYDELPGEVVMRYERSPKGYGFEFTVRKLIADKDYPPDNPENEVRREAVFEASTPYRNCVYQGATPEEAIGNLLLGMSFLTREGAINPHCPELKGMPIIQHVMEILSEHLAQMLMNRRMHLSDNSAWRPDSSIAKAEDRKQSATLGVSWQNEVIAAVGTAISALARVKDL